MKANKIYLYTNRNCLVFDTDDAQIPEYQIAMSCYKLDKALARRATEEATRFGIGKFREWMHEISREEMQYLLGVHDSQLETTTTDLNKNKRNGNV